MILFEKMDDVKGWVEKKLTRFRKKCKECVNRWLILHILGCFSIRWPENACKVPVCPKQHQFENSQRFVFL